MSVGRSLFATHATYGDWPCLLIAQSFEFESSSNHILLRWALLPLLYLLILAENVGSFPFLTFFAISFFLGALGFLFFVILFTVEVR